MRKSKQILVGIDAFYTNFSPTGIENYARSFIDISSKVIPNLVYYEYTIGFNRVDKFKQNDMERNAIWPSKVKNILRQSSLARGIYRKANSINFALRVKKIGLNFFHAFYFLPPNLDSTQFVPVVYDLSHIRYPDFHPRERVNWLKKLDKYLLTDPIVHTISEFTKNEIISVFGTSEQNIHIIPPKISSFYSDPDDNSLDIIINLCLSERRFFFAVGTLEPRKNLDMLVRSYANLPASLRERFPLVLAGGIGWGVMREKVIFDRLIREGSLRYLGYVTNRQLRALYRHATGVCFPSKYEGFGMPAAEAVVAGGSLCVSDIASLREASQGYAVFLDPEDASAWTAWMHQKIQGRSFHTDTKPIDHLLAAYNSTIETKIQIFYEDMIEKFT